MKIGFPVSSPNGLQSEVFGHFGSAPAFVIVDSAGEVRTLVNADAVHTHGQCSPIRAFGGESVDSIVVGGIGAGALGKLMSMGISVFKAGAPSIEANLALLGEGKLVRMNPMMTCGGHSGGEGCSHH